MSKRRAGVGTGRGTLELVNLGRGVRGAVRSEPDRSGLRTEGQGEEVEAVKTDSSVVKLGCEEKGKEIAPYLGKGGLSSRSLVGFSGRQRACLSDEGRHRSSREGWGMEGERVQGWRGSGAKSWSGERGLAQSAGGRVAWIGGRSRKARDEHRWGGGGVVWW